VNFILKMMKIPGKQNRKCHLRYVLLYLTHTSRESAPRAVEQEADRYLGA
jgi:hypothetical protein